MSASKTHLPVLDGLRGLAALVVVVSHCAKEGFLPGSLGQGFGQMGVTLFYALSGLLMARLYLDRPLTRDSLSDYAWRRGARVLPLYYATLGFGAVLLFGFGVSPYMQEDWRDVLRAALMIHGTGVLWSIPAEIQFYVVFVGLWYAAARGYLWAAMAGLILLQGLVAAVHYLNFGLANTYTLGFWLHAFLAGVLFGHLSTRPALARYADQRGAWAMGLSLVILAGALLAPPGVRSELGLPRTYPFVDPYSFGYPLLLLAAGLINLGAFRLFAGRVWRWLGKVSFSVYLVHMPVVLLVAALPESWGIPSLIKAALVFALTLAISALTERHIEKRAQKAILARGLPPRPPLQSGADAVTPPTMPQDAR